MGKKLSDLFFSTLKRASRLQRQALQRAVAPVTKKPRQSATKKAAKRASTRSATQPAVAAAHPRPTGKGIWQNFVHRTAPSHTELLGSLAYSLYRPKDPPAAGLPLVIMLHGCQQTAYEMALGTRMNALADKKGFVVAYPQQARRVQPMRCWRWFQPDAAHGLAEADAIADLAVALVRKYRLDATRVYIAGLSAGAGMAGLVVLRHPNVFAAAAMHSGAVLGAAHDTVTGMRTMRRGNPADPTELVKPLVDGVRPFPLLPVMILHGERDHVVSIRNAIQLAEQFNYLNRATAVKESVLAKGTHRQYARRDFFKGGQVAVRLCLLKDVGHAWSGGNSKLKFNSKTGPSAAVLMWQFFAMRSRAPAS